jgi:protein O-mannosyl-transferase
LSGVAPVAYPLRVPDPASLPCHAARRTIWLGAGIIAGVVALVLAAYASGFRGAFVFDDLPAIVENTTIKPGAGLAQWLQPPAPSTVAGRPLLNASFALNRALWSDSAASYRAVNVLIHLAAGGFLFGLVRRTLARVGMVPPTPPAAIIAGVWLLHPLQTESVTYVVQRAESLMGLFFLGAWYAFARSADSKRRPRGWQALTVGFALAGLATKESMATLPVVLLVYDRVYIAGSFGAAWRRRRFVYVALVCTWALLAYLMVGTHSRGGSAGFGTGTALLGYAGTQTFAVIRYLRLAVFPAGQVFDYGDALLRVSPRLMVYIIGYAALLAVTALAWWRSPRLGFLGVLFFILLAPTSTFMPVASQTIAEHRMYLPLIAPIVAMVLGACVCLGRRALPLAAIAFLVMATLTSARNRIYRDAETLWSNTVETWPDNARARDWLGLAYAAAGRTVPAVAEHQAAVALRPNVVKYRNNYGATLARLARYPAAIEQFEVALQLEPSLSEARHNLSQAETQLAMALIRDGQIAASIPHLRRVVQLDPNDPVAAYNLAFTLQQLGQHRD